MRVVNLGDDGGGEEWRKARFQMMVSGHGPIAVPGYVWASFGIAPWRIGLHKPDARLWTVVHVPSRLVLGWTFDAFTARKFARALEPTGEWTQGDASLLAHLRDVVAELRKRHAVMTRVEVELLA